MLELAGIFAISTLLMMVNAAHNLLRVSAIAEDLDTVEGYLEYLEKNQIDA